jgi:hypothetical protein
MATLLHGYQIMMVWLPAINPDHLGVWEALL